MTSPSVIGFYVRIDPIDSQRDVPGLWNALGGEADAMNDRLKWFDIPEFQSQQDLSNLLQGIENEGEGYCVNIFRTPHENMMEVSIVGMASYIAKSPENGSTEVAHGVAMAGTPMATEAHFLLARHCFETMGYRRCEWKCNSLNKPSRKAALRYGFQYEGTFRQHRVTAKGENRDTVWFSMIDKEWAERSKEMQAWLDISNFDENRKQTYRRLEDIRESNE